MKILMVAVSSSEHMSGVPRHAANAVRCLLTRSEVSIIHLVVGPWQYEAFQDAFPVADSRLQLHQVRVSRGALSRNLWYYNQLPGLAAKLEVDIVHLAFPSLLKRKAFQCSTVVTLHDFYPYDIPSNFGFPKMLFNRMVLRQCLRAVDSVACVSQSTLRRLDIYMPQIARQKAVTIYNCVDPGPAMATRSPIPQWEGEPFLLCVAQHRRNKNIPLAIEVFRNLRRSGDVGADAYLVIVGIEGPETEKIHRFIKANDLVDQVVLLRGISDTELEWCYGHCALLLAPSMIEGFGLPIVEAMFHHCPVVCTDIPAFREVGGSYCHYVPLGPHLEDSFALAARRALRHLQTRAGSTERFSGLRIAEAYLQLYTRLLHGGSAAGSRGGSTLVPSLERGS
jgi:glycosyltransferase involved in cell wall biosynthesis